jgi:hypothetical protein
MSRRPVARVRPMKGARRARWAVLVVAVTLAGCNGDAPQAEPPTTAGTSAPSTVAPPTTNDVQHLYLTDPRSWLYPGDETLIPPEKLEPVLAYVRARQAWIRAGMAPVDPDSPDLAATTGGVVLENVRRQLREKKASGEANHPPAKMKLLPLTFDIDGSKAILDFCSTEQVPTYREQTGEIIDNKMFSVDHVVEMQRRDGVWIMVAGERRSDFRDGESCNA